MIWNNSSANLLATTIDKTLNNPSDIIFQNSTKFPYELHRNPLVFPIYNACTFHWMHISASSRKKPHMQVESCHQLKITKLFSCPWVQFLCQLDLRSHLSPQTRLPLLKTKKMASSIWMKKQISTFNKSCFGFPQTHASKIVLSAWTPFIAPEKPFQPPSLFCHSFAHSPLGGRSMACMPPSRSNLKTRAMTHCSLL